MPVFTKKEIAVLRKLDSPAKIQDFLNNIPTNFEYDGETVLSPRNVLAKNRAHCIEAAIFTAAAFRFHGLPPLILDLTANTKDDDHVVAVFRKGKCWGAVSKSNHAVLRYREPVYRTVRELVMSYFHEYFSNNDGKKNLRSYSPPVDLSRFDKRCWMTSDKDLWYIADHLVEVKHFPILSRSQIASLRKADVIERKAGELVEWKRRS